MRHVQHGRRRGTTTVEFAVVLPVLLLFFFAAFEFARMNMIRHVVEVAAYEGARRGIVPGATADQVEDRAQQVLDAVGVANATITVSPNPITLQAAQVSVEIAVPLDDNAWVTPRFLSGVRFDRTFTLNRENVSWGTP